jgi:2'-5' RNA ligase
MPRAFLAIPLPLVVRSTFVNCRDAFVSHDSDWRDEKWVAEENLHVTLRFLGSVPDAACGTVADRVREALASVEPYRLRLDTVRAIPRPRSASLLWIAPGDGGAQTAQLADVIATAVEFLDFEPEGRAYKPHVTLCRARRPRRVHAGALDEIERVLARAQERETTVSVRQVTLFASTLTPRGPVYDELAIIPLGR